VLIGQGTGRWKLGNGLEGWRTGEEYWAALWTIRERLPLCSQRSATGGAL